MTTTKFQANIEANKNIKTIFFNTIIFVFILYHYGGIDKARVDISHYFEEHCDSVYMAEISMKYET